MKKKLLSIVIPTYNMERYLHRCLNSTLIEKRHLLEVIIVNDGSQDIDVVITASEKNDEVKALIKRIEDPLADTLLVSDAEGVTTVLNEQSIISISSGSKKLKIRAGDGVYKLRMSMQEAEVKTSRLLDALKNRRDENRQMKTDAISFSSYGKEVADV